MVELNELPARANWPKIERKFLARLHRAGPDDCWTWGRGTPYPQLSVGEPVPVYAHRISYLVFKGPLPDGQPVVRHTCDNPRCVNPAHLLPGTPKDNTADMVSRGRKHKVIGTANPRARLTEADVLSIRADEREYKTIGADYGVSGSLVGKIKNRHVWAQLDGPPSFINWHARANLPRQ